MKYRTGVARKGATADMFPQGRFNPKKCRLCGEGFIPESPAQFYCSRRCADDAHTDRYLRRCYGIGWDDYCRMHKEQKGLCAICGSPGFTMKECHTLKLVVDHDHETGAVRGLLCHNCNRGLGLFHDRCEDLVRALQYLKVQRPSRKGVGTSVPKRTAPVRGDDMV